MIVTKCEIIPETANQRFARVRVTLKMPPAEFASSLCLSRSYVYELEKGRRPVNERIARLVSLNLGVNERWLATGEGEMFDGTPGERRAQIMALFDKLRPEYQDYLLKHIDLLLRLQSST